MSDRARVVVTDFLNDSLEEERRILGDLADVEALGASSEAELEGRIDEAAAIMLYHEVAIGARTLARLRRCRLIVRCGVGADNVDCAEARRRGIPVANVPDYGSEEVADTALAMLLALARGVPFYNSRLRAGLGPWHYTQLVPRHRLRGAVLGIIGLGRIGTAVALRARALGMDVVFLDPYKPDGYDKALGIRRADTLDELLSQARFVSLHCPLSDETRRLIDAGAFARLPAGAYLINTARGGVVDGAALADALASGRLAGAALDVLEHEPPDETDPLVRAWRDPAHPAHERLLINPHAAFYSDEGLREIRVKAAQACRRALLGLPLRNIVN